MPELGPRTLKAIAEGPQTKTVFVATSRGGLETAERKEPLRAFARRVALIAVEEDRGRENAALRADNRKLALHTAEQAKELGKLRDQLKVANARIAELEAALKGMTNHYCELVLSGDAGIWNPEDEDQVKAARAALAKGGA